jgi:hypothetical protein
LLAVVQFAHIRRDKESKLKRKRIFKLSKLREQEQSKFIYCRNIQSRGGGRVDGWRFGRCIDKLLENCMNPHEALMDWYEWLSDDLKSDVDALVGLNLVAFQETHPSLALMPDVPRIFESWLKDIEGTPNQRATRVLIARTLIEFFVIRNRTPQQWERIVEMHRDSIERFTEEGQNDLVEPLRRIVERAPNQRRQWEMVIEDWEELCRTKLSDDAIEEWIFQMKYPADDSSGDCGI